MQETIKQNKKNTKNICAIIYGSRFNQQMRSFGPKYLHKDIFGKPLIETQIASIKKVFPNAEIIIIGGHEIDRLAKYKNDHIRIVENQLFEKTNEVEDIRLGINNTNCKNILTISADTYFNAETIKNITNHSCFIFDTKHQLSKSDLGLIVQKNVVERIDVGLDKKWCHICYFDLKHFRFLKKQLVKKNSKLFFFEILNKIINDGAVLRGIEPSNMVIYKIDTPNHLRAFKTKVF